jgi:hypothetical protein
MFPKFEETQYPAADLSMLTRASWWSTAPDPLLSGTDVVSIFIHGQQGRRTER